MVYISHYALNGSAQSCDNDPHPSRLSVVVISVAPITNSKPLCSCVHLLCPVLSLFFKSVVKCSYSI